MSLGDCLLEPTRIYVKPVLALAEQADLRAVSHITGGGFYENIPRALPEGLCAKIERQRVQVLPVFDLLAKTGKIPERDMGTICGRYLRKNGILRNLDESDEINACSVRIPVDNDGKEEPWLLLFKNETHNHPTEIEPFGGAATCIGGAIRDPLANRGYVYQAMCIICHHILCMSQTKRSSL